MDWTLTGSLIVHVLCAALLVGGAFFFRVIVLKYAALTPGGMSDELRTSLVKRWLHLAMMLLLTLLITGLYQMAALSDEWKAGKYPGMVPHMIFGVKFLLVLVVFLLVLTANVAKSAGLRSLMLTLNVVLGLLIVGLSVVLSNSYARGADKPAALPAAVGEKAGDLSTGS